MQLHKRRDHEFYRKADPRFKFQLSPSPWPSCLTALCLKHAPFLVDMRTRELNERIHVKCVHKPAPSKGSVRDNFVISSICQMRF